MSSSSSSLENKDRYLLTFEVQVQIIYPNIDIANTSKKTYQIFSNDISQQNILELIEEISDKEPKTRTIKSSNRFADQPTITIQTSEPILIKIFDMVDKKMIYS
jgi:hypothetical protein